MCLYVCVCVCVLHVSNAFLECALPVNSFLSSISSRSWQSHVVRRPFICAHIAQLKRIVFRFISLVQTRVIGN